MPRRATGFVHDQQIICRDCHDQLDPRCPTCGESLSEPIEATTPCPHCGWPIHVVREQDLFDSSLLNKEQHEQIGELRQKLGPLRRFDVTEGDYVRTRARLKQQIGQTPDEVTVMRRLFHKAAQNCRTPAQCALVEYVEARFLYEQGSDYYHVLRKAHRHHLESLHEKGCEQVTITGPETCAYCKKRAGVALPLDAELTDPELPYPDCPNRTADTELVIEGERHRMGVHKNVFCEATYEALS